MHNGSNVAWLRSGLLDMQTMLVRENKPMRLLLVFLFQQQAQEKILYVKKKSNISWRVGYQMRKFFIWPRKTTHPFFSSEKKYSLFGQKKISISCGPAVQYVKLHRQMFLETCQLYVRGQKYLGLSVRQNKQTAKHPFGSCGCNQIVDGCGADPGGRDDGDGADLDGTETSTGVGASTRERWPAVLRVGGGRPCT